MGHLVLSRKCDEAILIGNDVRIIVIDIKGDRCRLAIEAPREVEIDREEIRAAKKRGNK